MDTSTINIAERVKDARRDAKLTQTELGKRIGKSKQWVSELERGNIKLSFEMAVSILLFSTLIYASLFTLNYGNTV